MTEIALKHTVLSMAFHQRGSERKMFFIVDMTSTDSVDSMFQRLETICECFDSDPSLHSIPIHWRLPVKALDDDHSSRTRHILSRLRTRIASGTDMVVPAGFSSLPHQALLPVDVEIDLQWCGEHPATAETWDEFDIEKSLIYPIRPDTERASTGACYERCPFPILVSQLNMGEILVADRPPTPVSVVEYRALPRRRPDRFLRKLPVPGIVFLRIEDTIAIDAFERRELQRVSATIRNRGGYKFRLALELIEDRTDEIPGIRSGRWRDDGTTLPLTEGDRKAVLLATYTREELNRAARRKRDGNTRKNAFVATDGDRTAFRNRIEAGSLPPPREHPVEQRILVSDMTGDVVLAGEGVFATFEAGRLADLQRDGLSARFANPSSSWMSVGGFRKQFEIESAFSFEEPGIRGLQQRLICRTSAFSEPVRLGLDTFFVDNSRYLYVHARTTFPEARQDISVTELHPFDITLELPKGSARVTSRYPDGEIVEKTYAHSVGLDYIWGTAFEIGDLSRKFFLFSPELEATGIQCIPVRALPVKEHVRLSIAMCGVAGPASSECYAGSVFTALFGIDLLDQPNHHVPILPRDVADRLREGYYG